MKRCEKLDLNGLKKRFEILDASSASQMEGRAWYVNPDDGSVLGQLGSSNEIRFLSATEFGYYQHYQVQKDDAGTSFANASDEAQSYFLKQFLPSGYSGAIEKNYNQAVVGAMAWTVTNGNFDKFQYNPTDPIFNDFNNFKNTMAHENAHLMGHHTTDNPNNEISAINAQINHSSYADVSFDYKKRVGDYLFQQWKDLKIDKTPGHSLHDAYVISGYQLGP